MAQVNLEIVLLRHVVARRPIQEVPYILHRRIHQPLARLVARPRDVRRDNHVVQPQQRVIRPNRLGGHHVRRGGVHLAGQQSIPQIRFVDEPAARGIEQNHAVFHLHQRGFVNHADVLRGLRAVQGHNVAAGVRFAYNRTYLDMSNFELNLGEDFNINLKDLYWLEHKYEVSGFLRTYMPIGKSKIFGLFNEVRLTYGYSTGKNSTGSGTEYDGTFERAHNLQIGIAPGMAAFITNWSAVEVSVGVMGYNFKWQNQTTNQIESGTRRTSSGNFKINLFSINIGMTFYL